jgi:hypothetical protein
MSGSATGYHSHDECRWAGASCRAHLATRFPSQVVRPRPPKPVYARQPPLPMTFATFRKLPRPENWVETAVGPVFNRPSSALPPHD